LSAIKGDGSGELWSFPTPAPNISGVAVAAGVVYFSSIDGSFYAVNAADGTLLARVDTSFSRGDVTIAGVSSGPSLSRGPVHGGLGDRLPSLFNPFFAPPGGAIVALGLPAHPGLRAASPGGGGVPARTTGQVVRLLSGAAADGQAADTGLSPRADVPVASETGPTAPSLTACPPPAPGW